MMKSKTLLLLLLFVSIFGVGLEAPFAESPPNPSNQELVLAGSGNCLPIITKLAEEFTKSNPTSPIRIKVLPSIGTKGAVTAITKGSLNVGLSSRALKDEEKKEGLSEIKFATIGIIFGVNASVPDTNITGPELVEIFSGKKTQWQNGKTIVVLNREEGDSTIAVLMKKIDGFTGAYNDSIREKRWVVLFTDKEAHESLSKTVNAFGFCDSTIIMFPYQIKMLSFNQIEPTLDNIKSGKYPFSKDLYFIFKGKSIPAEANEFIEFVKSSRAAKILQESGALPVKD